MAARVLPLAVTWNAYRWTDAAGSRLAAERVPMLPLVMSRTDGGARRWDSVAEFPACLAPMEQATFLDRESGDFVPAGGHLHSASAGVNIDFFRRAAELHFARTAMAGMQAAMLRALHRDDQSEASTCIDWVEELKRLEADDDSDESGRCC
uniref:Uncharacterized protein n=1 Tax=Zooxanthella nutricula TaxID=1333877 RepID=A0A7S2L0N0_9DINO